ncbi:MAG: hypothetical protein LPK46_09290 [Bacteroidota bacterium]|nr:hypothetical protein [Bacteroidota bacterium]MDX5506317.1 hypothetical protein [Bacteroidota bacterium]
MNRLVIVLMLILPCLTQAQEVFFGSGASYSGMAFSGLTFNGRSTATLNPSMLNFQENSVVGFGVSQPYLLENLTRVYGYGAFKMGNGFGGLHLKYDGQKSFNRTGTMVFYSLPLTKGLSAFAEGGYWFSPLRADGTRLSGFTSRFGITGNWRSWILTANAINPVRQTNGNGSDDIFLYGGTFGLGYSPSDRFWIGLDLYLMEDRNPEWRYGISYKIVDVFALRGGISPDLNTWSIGLGIQWEEWVVDLGYAQHTVLGQTPEITISYAF